MTVAYVQEVKPDVNVWGYSGGCLQYVDDGVDPPNRQPTAQASWDLAVKTGKAHVGQEPPNNVWVPVYYSIDNGQWAGYGHVAWYYSDGKTTKIYDSEFGAGIRKQPYSSGAELFNHMGWQMRYYGWSEAVDGLTIVKPKPQENKPTQPTQKKKGNNNMIIIHTEKNNYIVTAEGYYSWIPADDIYNRLKAILPETHMQDGHMRSMFKNFKDEKG